MMLDKIIYLYLPFFLMFIYIEIHMKPIFFIIIIIIGYFDDVLYKMPKTIVLSSGHMSFDIFRYKN